MALVKWLWGKHSPYNIPYFLLDYSWFSLKDGVSCITIGKSICLFVCFTNRVPALISFSSLPWKEECPTANSWGKHINYCLSWLVSLNINFMRTSQPRIELKFLKFQPTSFLGTHSEGKGPGNEVKLLWLLDSDKTSSLTWFTSFWCPHSFLPFSVFFFLNRWSIF